MRNIKLVLYLCFWSIMVSAHEIQHITTFTDRNGLSQNTVRCMLQDSNGFMWMGTVNGLNRFNGKEFTVVQPPNGSSISFLDNRIRNITEDKNGFIWIRTFSNTIFCYDPRSEVFIDYYPENILKRYSNIMVSSAGDVWLQGPDGCCRIQYIDGKLQSWNPGKDKLQNAQVSFVFEDSKKNVWIGYEKKLLKITNDVVKIVEKDFDFFSMQELDGYLYLISDNHISVFDIKRQSFLSDIPTAKNVSLANSRSCRLNDGIILIATKTGIQAFDSKKKVFISALRFFQNQHLNDASFQIDNKGHIWVYNMSGILWKHNADNTFEPLKLFPPEILSLINWERYQIYHDSRDITWIITFGNGLFAIDRKSEKVYHYTAEKDFLPTNYLMCVTEDHSGEIWVGTELGGVSKISLTNYPFDVFYPTIGGNNDRDNAVRLIYQDSEDQYWFGTRDGNLHVCDSLFRQKSVYRIKGGLPFTIAEDTLGYKWLGTKGDGVLIFPLEKNAVPKTYWLQDKDRQNSSSNNIYSIIRDSKKRMWIASFGGGLHLAQRTSSGLAFRQIYLQKEHQNMMRSMIQDHSGLIWVGCNEGVIVFDPDEIIHDENKYLNLRLDTDDPAFNNNEVRVVFEDSHKRIWLGTTGGGLNLLDRKDPIEESSFKHYDSKNGLSNEMIQAIIEDNEGYIWVSTESGISKFNAQTEHFENFIFSNNRQAAIFNELSSWKKKNGELMFGSYNGVFKFDPSKITYDTYAPPVLMTGLRINGNIMSPQGQDSPLDESIIVTKKITLSHNQNSFNLEFMMPNYHAPEFNKYVYILEGFEKNWNPISRNNLATYRNIPPGTYLFKVKGCNSFGVWSDTETSLQIIVNPPWWKSGWAILLYVILIVATTYFIFKIVFKMQRLNMAVEVEKQLTEYKLRFFTNISHEFRTPLTIIRGSIETLENVENLSPVVKKQLNILTKSSTRLLKLIDQLLEFRRLQNNKLELRLEPTEVKGFFYDIYLTFKDMAEKKQIKFVFETNESKCDMLIDKNKMDKIAYNLLSNAFKNTPKGGEIIMSLHFSAQEDTFIFNVSDSGPGIPSEHRDTLFERFKQIKHSTEGTGIGLHLTSELVKVHKGNITYEDSILGGGSFTVCVPLSNKNYDKVNIIDSQSTDDDPVQTEMPSGSIITGEELANSPLEKPFDEYKVMVIEDDDDVRAFLENQLSQYFTVSVATNGAEGLEKVAEEQPNIVVCDVMMPEMDGYKFTKRLKENFETSHIPVILLTAYSSEEHQLKGIQAGADSYITKPFSGRYLLTRIVKLIEQREKLQHKFATEPGLVKSSISLTDRDKMFLDKLHNIIDENYSNADLKIETFAQSFNMGRTTFFRKLKGITGCSPNEYLRVIRMKKAAELLMISSKNISEISFEVGINDPFYLSRCFKAQFGMSPSQYRNRNNRNSNSNNENDIETSD